MTTLLMSVFLGISSFVATAESGLIRSESEAPDREEDLLKSSAKIRTLLTKFAEELTQVVLSDNEEIASGFAEAQRRAHLEYMAIMDKVDAEIKSKTLTTQIVWDLDNKVNQALREELVKLKVDLQLLTGDASQK